MHLKNMLFLMDIFVSFDSTASFLRYTLCGIGGALLLSGLAVLTCIDQDDARHSFGHSGGMFSFA